MDARGAKVVCLAGAAAVSALVAYHVGKYVQRRRSRNAGCTSLDIRPPFPRGAGVEVTASAHRRVDPDRRRAGATPRLRRG